jgi:hypothetical protein
MIIRASPHPAAMYWGEELVAIYNEAYIGTFAFASILTCINTWTRTRRAKTPRANGPELQSSLGGDME